MEFVESVKSQDYSVSQQASQSALSLAVWDVDGFRQYLLLRLTHIMLHFFILNVF